MIASVSIAGAKKQRELLRRKQVPTPWEERPAGEQCCKALRRRSAVPYTDIGSVNVGSSRLCGSDPVTRDRA
jgi:hypothetical protein